nr:tRNA lysidine(34) synthetase TilS [Bacteroidota bacterium]
ALLSYIKKENLFNPSDKLLLTVSGGIDSVVMCELFHQAELNFAIAHCDFQLRGKESKKDALFVKQLAKKYKVPFFCKQFDTAAYADGIGISIQMAARDMRYEWFEEIRKNEKFHFIATAHHQDDSIETFFINLIRGTGISGLHGIMSKQGRIIRPLLFTNKTGLEAFAKKHGLKHREDSSNQSDKYVRNKIRHHVIPVLKELNPVFENSFNNTIQRLRDVEAIYKLEVENKRSKIVIQGENTITINIQQLKNLNRTCTYLYEFLKPYDFNADTVESIFNSLDAESGKQFFSATHRLVKDRGFLKIEIRKFNFESGISSFKFHIDKDQKQLVVDGLKLKFKLLFKLPKLNFQNPTSAFIDLDKLKFPLEVRKWQKGDTFYPLGMKGKKKLSDFFIDKKLSLHQKENIWLLSSQGKIVWVIGLRIDDRFKITDKTKKIYFVELV